MILNTFFLKRKLQKNIQSIYFNRKCLQQNITPKYANIKIPNTSHAAFKTQKKASILREENTKIY